MNTSDLADLDRLILAPAAAVVTMHAVHEGATDPDVVGLRHDVDDNADSLDTALKIARWEHNRGYHASFFMLHTASYWGRPGFAELLAEIEGFGHEIGIHANAVAAALRTGGDPAEILTAAIDELRGYGHTIVGVAPHGDELCRDPDGHLIFVNDEMFSECARPTMGAPDREIVHGDAAVTLAPQPLAAFGLEYECYRLPRGRYLSDSGNSWSLPLDQATDRSHGQLHVLWHPDWWAEAL